MGATAAAASQAQPEAMWQPGATASSYESEQLQADARGAVSTAAALTGVADPVSEAMGGMLGQMNGGVSMGGWSGTGGSPGGSSYVPEGQPGIPPPPPPPAVPEGPTVTMAALSIRQPFASLILYGVKQLEARTRPTLKQVQGPLAIHVSHKEEPYDSHLVSMAVAILRRRYPDEAISQLFQLPPAMAQGHGCVVGIVDVESTWHADLFTEVEQMQLTEQAVYPATATFLTQFRSPRWLNYPVRATGSNKLWEVVLPHDALPKETEFDQNGRVAYVPTATNLDRSPYGMGAGGAAGGMEGDDAMLGMLGGDFVRQLGGGGDTVGELEKRKKKLHKALRQIEELKMKRAEGNSLEKTQESKIEREEELLAELAALEAEEQGTPAASDLGSAPIGIPQQELPKGSVERLPRLAP